MTMAAIGATTPPKMTSKSFSIYGAQIKGPHPERDIQMVRFPVGYPFLNVVEQC